MKTLIWQTKRTDIDHPALADIMRAVVAQGIPMESAVIKDRGTILNFKDEVTDGQLEQAVQIAEAYDPVATAAAKQAVIDARATDLRPFKQIQTLLDASVRDEAGLDTATLSQLRGLLKGLFEREQAILKGMARLIENLPINGGG